MDLVVPQPGSGALGRGWYRWFLVSEGSRRRTRCRGSHRRGGCWSGKTRISLHCPRRKKYDQRDQRNGGEARDETNP